jgi:hypothetical protein
MEIPTTSVLHVSSQWTRLNRVPDVSCSQGYGFMDDDIVEFDLNTSVVSDAASVSAVVGSVDSVVEAAS